ncbi:MAG: S8 family serine peptidase, partial [Phycisphaerae bacterium]
ELESAHEVAGVSRVPLRYLHMPRAAARSKRRPRVDRSRAARAARPTRAAPAASGMWNLDRIDWAAARGLPGFQDADEQRIAVLDTGIDAGHSDLVDLQLEYVHAYPDAGVAASDRDIVGHGTHVAGTIGAAIGNALGINGICRCRLIAYKIFADNPAFFSLRDGFQYVVEPRMYVAALADCLERGVNVINLSIGGTAAPDETEAALFELLLDAGVTIVAAMGNEREEGSPTSYPAAMDGVIAVGATSRNDRVANFSNGGPHIALCAPGVAIWSTLPRYPGQFGFEAIPTPEGPRHGQPQSRETEYDAWPGTSMASPHVAGAAALLLANNRRMTPAQVREGLMNTADRVAGMGGADFDLDYGAGRLNLKRLLS